MKSTSEIRSGFLEFFNSKGHQIVDSSSLIPENDPTLLFINAGMNQFKNVFLGQEKRSYTRATTAQRCVRAGGKHNDLENVGFTARHHTFFEMMGNFSFGDYFKKDAITYVWEFLTSPNYLALDPERLTVTVYETDDEAYNIWANQVGVPKERIIRIGDNKGAPFASDNFWQMADTGPCGPSTEIFYDHGDHIWGGPPGSPEEDGDRFIEIWNIVFMQYNRLEDGTLEPLPRPSVDTGMGIERVAAIKQHVNSNYDIDIFAELIKQASIVTGVEVNKLTRQSLNVIADHIRSCTFLIGDGILPSNEGRGYVLRRIIRRAIRHGYLLGCKESFFHKLVPHVIKVMDSAAAHLASDEVISYITKAIRLEEEQFARTLVRGISLLNEEIESLQKAGLANLSGDVAFTLLDTFGFPIDLTIDICKEKNITVDIESFEAKMDEQRALAKASSKFTADYSNIIKTDIETYKSFYDNNAVRDKATVVALYKNGQEVQSLNQGDEAIIILDRSCFYGESGGQVGDTGVIFNDQFEFKVSDTQKFSNALGHIGTLNLGNLSIGDNVELKVDVARRNDIVLNHSAAHLLHAAVKQVLGKQVQQKGAYTTNTASRFDISHNEALSRKQIQEIEELVNYHIRQNHQVEIREMPINEALSLGANALFTEKYGDVVRVVIMSPWSIELCGGTHVNRTGDIGLFKLLSDSAISAGVRRLTYVTGTQALELVNSDLDLLDETLSITGKAKHELLDGLIAQRNLIKKLEKELAQLKEEVALATANSLLNQVEKINDVDVLCVVTNKFDSSSLKSVAVNILNQKLGNKAVVIIANLDDDKGSLVVANKGNILNAGLVVKEITSLLNGKGGGKPDVAMGAFTNINDAEKVVSSFKDKLKRDIK